MTKDPLPYARPGIGRDEQQGAHHHFPNLAFPGEIPAHNRTLGRWIKALRKRLFAPKHKPQIYVLIK